MVMGESGQAYQKSIRFRGIDANVAYYDPSGPPPPIETSQQPEQKKRSDGDWSVGGDVSFVPLLISAAFLVAIAWLFARFGSGFSVSLGRDGDNAERMGQGRRGRALADEPATPSSLTWILRIQDRREALIQLARTALITSVSAQGVLLQKSWTARDALRRLPADQSHLGALRQLVLASERAHFGGREVSEEEFQAHVRDIRPLLSESTP